MPAKQSGSPRQQSIGVISASLLIAIDSQFILGMIPESKMMYSQFSAFLTWSFTERHRISDVTTSTTRTSSAGVCDVSPKEIGLKTGSNVFW